MLTRDERSQLGALQTEFVNALTVPGTRLEGFDAGRMEFAAAALACKRERAVARAWPRLARALGGSYHEYFSTFANSTPLPFLGGPVADGRLFAKYLAADGGLPDAGRLEALAFDLRYASGGKGLRPRRGPIIGAAVLRSQRRLVLAIRWSWIGEQWLSIPWGRKPANGSVRISA